MRRREPRLDLLRSVPGLAGCGDQQLRSLLAHVDERDVPAGTALTREGEPGDEAYVIVEGRAEVTLRGRLVAVLGPGQFVGETPVLDPAAVRSATVTAATSMRLLAIGVPAFDRLLAEPVVSRQVTAALAERLRRSNGNGTGDGGKAGT